MKALEELIEDVKNELDYEYSLLTPVTKEFLGRDILYRTKVTTLTQAEKFNYHSDYWGRDSKYEWQNTTAIKFVKPYINKISTYNGKKVKVLGMLIDNQYNSIGHTNLLIEEID